MENTLEKKLNALLNLQAIDCELDNIVKIRGALPEEVADLENELTALKTRLRDIQEEIASIEQEVAAHRVRTKTLEATVKKYEEQQMNVRNNREYDAITKEIELQKLEIQITEKKVRGAYERIEDQKLALAQCQDLIVKQQEMLTDKQDALQVLIGESEGEAQKLDEQRKKATKHIDTHLLEVYERIRANVRNKLAVVTVKREACGGCFSQVPPQQQADIKEKRAIIMCEHCGRILADVLTPPQED
ncbi:MAG: zinc ribbon domain-containing protein [Bacteroidota bacterium]